MDSPEEKAIVYLNMARVKLIALTAALNGVKTKREFHHIKLDKLEFATQRIRDAVQTLHSIPDVNDEIQTELDI